ncbi:MAG TPA: hypothetical protein PLX97_15830, partial [Gemmatales bacterium]|nr:hypothetical protein [Gemmatales bacterium]
MNSAVKGDRSTIVPADDSNTTLQSLKAAMQHFVTERAWEQFHSPKNLAMSLAIEAAEVMEHVQWLEPAASRELKDD